MFASHRPSRDRSRQRTCQLASYHGGARRDGPSPRNEITTQDLTEAKALMDAGVIDSTSLKKLEDQFCQGLWATLRALLAAIA